MLVHWPAGISAANISIWNPTGKAASFPPHWRKEHCQRWPACRQYGPGRHPPGWHPCEPGEIGEICIQGSSVCAGYWQNPEETKRFHTVIAGYNGQFYRTGDMGVLYEGQLYLTGRIKEMIIISGKNIFPGDITLLLRQEGVPLPADAIAVFSLPSPEGEHPILCAESTPNADYAAIAAQVNRLTARNFGFSFWDVAFTPAGSLPAPITVRSKHWRPIPCTKAAGCPSFTVAEAAVMPQIPSRAHPLSPGKKSSSHPMLPRADPAYYQCHHPGSPAWRLLRSQ